MGYVVKSIFIVFVLLLGTSFSLFSEPKAAASPHGKKTIKQNVTGERCNLFEGSWVLDNNNEKVDYLSTCPFINDEFNCLKYERPDRKFLNYSWKPSACNLPRFDGRDFLRSWAGKNIMFVGDSLSENMWQSLVCMIQAAAPAAGATLQKKDQLNSVTFQTYKLTLALFRSPYLVDIIKQPSKSVLTLNSITGDGWLGKDVLIFNTWHWYLHKGDSRRWDFIQNGTQELPDMDPLNAFRIGLRTWANWVDTKVDSSRTRVFFQGISPTHYLGSEWNEPKRNCLGQQEPLPGSSYPAGSLAPAAVVIDVLRSMKTPVNLLDITLLSQLRKDAHPSVYNGDQFANDCSHWCLPGLPDTWNQLLYAILKTNTLKA